MDNLYIEESFSLLERILNTDIKTIVYNEFINDSSTLILGAYDILDHNYKNIMDLSNIKKLGALTLCLGTAYNNYKELDISEDIFFETFKDLKIWVDDCKETFNEVGLNELNWLHLHVNLEIFKIGRLQYQIAAYEYDKPLIYNNINLNKNDKFINIHIPRGEKLDITLCKESIIEARKFLNKYFKNLNKDFGICNTWLLHPNNKEILDNNSNIIKFITLFEIIKVIDEYQNPIRFIFGSKEALKLKEYYIKTNDIIKAINNLNTINNFQVKAKNYLLEGKKLGSAIGICFFNIINLD